MERETRDEMETELIWGLKASALNSLLGSCILPVPVYARFGSTQLETSQVSDGKAALLEVAARRRASSAQHTLYCSTVQMRQ